MVRSVTTSALYLCYHRSLFSFFFFFNDTATTEIYTLSLHDALPILKDSNARIPVRCDCEDHDEDCGAEGSRSVDLILRSEEHTSELQSLAYLVCRLLLEKKKKKEYWLTTETRNKSDHDITLQYTRAA